MFVPKIDNQSNPEEPCTNSGPWKCSICAQENDTSLISCELCGVLRDLSLYFSNINESEGGAKRRNKHSGVSVLARSLFTPSSPKSKAFVFLDGFQGNKNATGYSQASLDALHKTYMTHKQRHISIVPFKFDIPSPDDMVSTGLKSSRHLRRDFDITVKKVVNADDLVTDDTNLDPSSSVKLDEVGGSSSRVAADTQDKTLVLDNELQNLSLERKTKNNKAKIKKPKSVSQYKPERWMLQGEDQGMPRQLNLAIDCRINPHSDDTCDNRIEIHGSQKAP